MDDVGEPENRADQSGYQTGLSDSQLGRLLSGHGLTLPSRVFCLQSIGYRKCVRLRTEIRSLLQSLRHLKPPEDRDFWGWCNWPMCQLAENCFQLGYTDTRNHGFALSCIVLSFPYTVYIMQFRLIATSANYTVPVISTFSQTSWKSKKRVFQKSENSQTL